MTNAFWRLLDFVLWQCLCYQCALIYGYIQGKGLLYGVGEWLRVGMLHSCWSWWWLFRSAELTFVTLQHTSITVDLKTPQILYSTTAPAWPLEASDDSSFLVGQRTLSCRM